VSLISYRFIYLEVQHQQYLGHVSVLSVGKFTYLILRIIEGIPEEEEEETGE
jgi:hypothetical protein